ncbi:MAG: sugar phosphate isomerase/epimerase [Mariniphaga sp.]|nr:sugar phosphate isomerase/epimerase [Mariniphaga sp.]
MQSRRNFIKKSLAGAAAIGMAGSVWAGEMLGPETKRPIHVFTKCLQFLSYEEMAEVLAKHGFAGADLTVRPGGQVLPENVEMDLPKAVKALRNLGIDSKMITTSVNNPEDKFTRPILKTMAELGIRYYRTGYIDYDNSKSIPDNLEAHKTTFEKLEKLNREYGVTGNYQNHSGRRVGGPVWDLYELLKDLNPEHIGVQYDVRHATVEGGVSWPLGLQLLAPWIRTTDIKDFVWEKNEKGEWKIKNVPLGEGMVDFKTYLELYKSLGIEGPVSIHYEYDLGGAEHGSRNPEMPLGEISEWLKKDLNFLKNQFREFSL